VEVAAAVEEAHADKRDAQVGGGLEVIAGEAAQAAGVDLEALGQAELGAEIRDLEGLLRGERPAGLREPAAVLHVLDELGMHGAEGVDEGAIGGGAVELLLTYGAEHDDRVVPAGLPEVTVKPAKKIDGLVVPGPPEVVSDLGEGPERLGKRGDDPE